MNKAIFTLLLITSSLLTGCSSNRVTETISDIVVMPQGSGFIPASCTLLGDIFAEYPSQVYWSSEDAIIDLRNEVRRVAKKHYPSSDLVVIPQEINILAYSSEKGTSGLVYNCFKDK